MSPQSTDPIFDILGQTFDEKFFRTRAKSCKTILDKEGILVLPDFISLEVIKELQGEAKELKPKAYRSNSAYNLYVLPQDPDFPEDAPRNRQFRTTKGCIADDQIPQKSYLKAIYNSKTFRNFLCKVLGIGSLYSYADPLSRININYYDPKDSLQWHFDNADFAITLLIKKCAKGGEYEYFTNMRYKENGEDYERVRKCIDGEIDPQKKSLNEGGLMIFRGNQSLHRVTEIQAGERILITLNFNKKPGIPLSEKSRQTFFGRTR